MVSNITSTLGKYFSRAYSVLPLMVRPVWKYDPTPVVMAFRRFKFLSMTNRFLEGEAKLE